MRRLLLLCAIHGLFCPLVVQAQQTTLFGGVKTGGFAGRFAVGIGASSPRHCYDVSAWYGYTNHRDLEETVQSVELMALLQKRIIKLGEQGNLNIKAGISGIWYHSPNVFAKLPSQYPPNYYQPTAFAALGQALLCLRHPIQFSTQQLPFEAGIGWSIPAGMAWYAMVNRQPNFFELSTLSISLRVHVPDR